jgi:hypothetical protein
VSLSGFAALSDQSLRHRQLLPDLSQHASCQPRRAGRSWCTSGSRIGGLLVFAVWRSGDVNRGPAHGDPRDEDRGGASLLVLARGDLSIGLARRMQVARSISTNAQLSGLEKRRYGARRSWDVQSKCSSVD